MHDDSSVPDRNYYVLIGLLNRCFRLMLANIALSHEGRFGETTSIIDRSIVESALTISWLSENPSDKEFSRYLAAGLKTEIEFKSMIKQNVQENAGVPTTLETRMLASIESHIRLSRLTETEIAATKKFRNIASLVSGLGLQRLFYVTAQRMGSHHVHGTWPSLLFHYLETSPDAPARLVPRDHDCSAHINQYMFIPMVAPRAMSDFVSYFLDEDSSNRWLNFIDRRKSQS